jgi:hypothetical protein
MARKFIMLRGRRYDLSRCEVADAVRKRAYWFAAVFKNGLRVPEQIGSEWDFRFVKTVEEARDIAFYEYAREVEWIYDYHAEWLSLITKFGKSQPARKATAEFRQKWDDPEGYCSDPFLLSITGHWMEPVFPIPAAEVPFEIRGDAKTTKNDGVINVDLTGNSSGSRTTDSHRVHAVKIDWSLPNSQLETALARWLREMRPHDVQIRTATRGKRIRRPFELLKWLAASRLAASGVSFSQAVPLIRAAHHDGCGVLPLFASQGAWATAVKKARSLVVSIFPDPRKKEK